MLDMANDSGLFRTAETLFGDGRFDGLAYSERGNRLLPLLEGKMINLWNPRANTYVGQTQAQANKGVLPPTPQMCLTDPACLNQPKYWVPEHEVRNRWNGSVEWALAFRDIGPKERTFLPTIVPAWGVGHKLPLMHVGAPYTSRVACLLACMSSFVVDYLARQRTDKGGMSFFVVKQIPVLSPAIYDDPSPWEPATDLWHWIAPRAVELTYTAWHLEAFAASQGVSGPPLRWDAARRTALQAELDAAFFQLYGLGRDDAEHVLDSFELVRTSDEAAHGEYRTKRLILEVYDAMTKAIETAVPYQTVLDPPPADPSLAHPGSTRPAWAPAPDRAAK
jgi:hypothetical protein